MQRIPCWTRYWRVILGVKQPRTLHVTVTSTFILQTTNQQSIIILNLHFELFVSRKAMAALYTPTQEISNLDILDDDHRNTLDRAVRNVLSTEPAERAYAQILDGLPTEQSLRDSQDYVKDHPVHSIEHSEICPGYIEKAREFRNGFDLFQLRLGSKVRSSRSTLLIS
jgi:hypothetical protein